MEFENNNDDLVIIAALLLADEEKEEEARRAGRRPARERRRCGHASCSYAGRTSGPHGSRDEDRCEEFSWSLPHDPSEDCRCTYDAAAFAFMFIVYPWPLERAVQTTRGVCGGVTFPNFSNKRFHIT